MMIAKLFLPVAGHAVVMDGQAEWQRWWNRRIKPDSQPGARLGERHPGLNNIEPQWIDGKRAAAELGRVLRWGI
jgi:hypothetical protein